MVGFALFLALRLLGIAVLAWVTTLVAFGLFGLGVPSQLADGQIDAQLGQGEPASWQYAHYLLRLLHGNLGGSITVGLPVDTVLSRALPPTLSLMIGGILLWLIIGITAGLVSALRALVGRQAADRGDADDDDRPHVRRRPAAARPVLLDGPIRHLVAGARLRAADP